ncbi:MAG: sigma-70 family RNA polymerase sigma factor [Clostridium sp.]|nr:sigma-70 family RNA polymerase sigma factor [Clostridium sp.]MCM1444228.1 sigma-70 family RNA polymerase sigma factor [Candidatus Amulumruptor caecigallinarius]
MINYKYVDNLVKEAPYPLNEQELYDYLKKYKSGDYNARNEIIKHNIRFVGYIVKNNFLHTFYDVEDLVEIGKIGLIKGVDSFDINKNTSFASYVSICIKNEISMFLKKEKKHKNNYSLDEPIKLEENKDKTHLNNIEDRNFDLISKYEKKELYEFIKKIIEEFPDINKKIIKLYFGFDDDKTYTQIEICKKLNLKKLQVQEIIREALERIKLSLNQEGLINVYQKEKNKKLSWNEMYLLAKAYYEYHKNLDVKHNFKTTNGYEYDKDGYYLGYWIFNQRAANKNNKLSIERKKLLLLIEMRFETANYQEIWDEWYKLLKIYYDHHKNLNIIRRFKTINGYKYDENGKCLGIWFHDQMALYKKGRLPLEKINLLNQIDNTVFNFEKDKEKVYKLRFK